MIIVFLYYIDNSSLVEELDEKIANFNPEYNYNERRTRIKGSCYKIRFFLYYI